MKMQSLKQKILMMELMNQIIKASDPKGNHNLDTLKHDRDENSFFVYAFFLLSS